MVSAWSHCTAKERQAGETEASVVRLLRHYVDAFLHVRIVIRTQIIRGRILHLALLLNRSTFFLLFRTRFHGVVLFGAPVGPAWGRGIRYPLRHSRWVSMGTEGTEPAERGGGPRPGGGGSPRNVRNRSCERAGSEHPWRGSGGHDPRVPAGPAGPWPAAASTHFPRASVASRWLGPPPERPRPQCPCGPLGLCTAPRTQLERGGVRPLRRSSRFAERTGRKALCYGAF